MPLIKAENLTLAYEGNNVAENLSFSVEENDYLFIIGENGSGKSTLTKALLGLINPASGSVSYGCGLKKNEIGYLPQQTDVQKDFPSSVYEIVLSGCQNKLRILPFYTKEQKDKAKRVMKNLGIDNEKNSCYNKLSGGQQQRVLLARAMCATDRLLILDEPAAGLDPMITEQLYSAVNFLNQNMHITIIMVSHDLSAVRRYAKNVLHLTETGYVFAPKSEYIKTNPGKNYLRGESQ